MCRVVLSPRSVAAVSLFLFPWPCPGYVLLYVRSTLSTGRISSLLPAVAVVVSWLLVWNLMNLSMRSSLSENYLGWRYGGFVTFV